MTNAGQPASVVVYPL